MLLTVTDRAALVSITDEVKKLEDTVPCQWLYVHIASVLGNAGEESSQAIWGENKVIV